MYKFIKSVGVIYISAFSTKYFSKIYDAAVFDNCHIINYLKSPPWLLCNYNQDYNKFLCNLGLQVLYTFGTYQVAHCISTDDINKQVMYAGGLGILAGITSVMLSQKDLCKPQSIVDIFVKTAATITLVYINHDNVYNKEILSADLEENQYIESLIEEENFLNPLCKKDFYDIVNHK